MTAVTLQSLCKRFDDVHAVANVDLTIASGELFFLIGPSGCGKTTLLRMIAGFIDPTAGEICFDGRSVVRVPANRRNVGMVFQSYALWPHLSVFDNVAFGLDARRVRGRERRRRVEEALATVQLHAMADRMPAQLSGGQQQRVALARALVIRPAVLLLDEPLSNLDARLRLEMRSSIQRICREAQTTTIYVTHDQKEALSMADRVAVMHNGRVEQVGPPRELYARPTNCFVADFLGETNVLPGRVMSRQGDVIGIDTAVGRLWSKAVGASTPEGTVLCSIRPERICVGPADSTEARATPPLSPSESSPPVEAPTAGRSTAADGSAAWNTLTGRIISSVFLGDSAQYDIQITSDVVIKHVSAPPRGDVDGGSAGDLAVQLTIDPTDVVILRNNGEDRDVLRVSAPTS